MLLPPLPSIAGLVAYTALVRRCWAENQLDRPGFHDIVRELRWVLSRQSGLCLLGYGCGGGALSWAMGVLGVR